MPAAGLDGLPSTVLVLSMTVRLLRPASPSKVTFLMPLNRVSVVPPSTNSDPVPPESIRRVAVSVRNFWSYPWTIRLSGPVPITCRELASTPNTPWTMVMVSPAAAALHHDVGELGVVADDGDGVRPAPAVDGGLAVLQGAGQGDLVGRLVGPEVQDAGPARGSTNRPPVAW